MRAPNVHLAAAPTGLCPSLSPPTLVGQNASCFFCNNWCLLSPAGHGPEFCVQRTTDMVCSLRSGRGTDREPAAGAHQRTRLSVAGPHRADLWAALLDRCRRRCALSFAAFSQRWERPNNFDPPRRLRLYRSVVPSLTCTLTARPRSHRQHHASTPSAAAACQTKPEENRCAVRSLHAAGEGAEQLDAAEAARIFEGQLAGALLAEDGQLALSSLASNTLSTLMPKLETQGRVGQAR